MEYTYDTMIFDDLKICQLKEGGFRFGCDSLILAYFTKAKQKSLIADVGSGSGIIASLIAKIYKSNVEAIELQKEMYECLIQTIKLSNLEDKIKPINADIRKIPKSTLYDGIVCNPPYRKEGTGKTAKDNIANIARFSITMTMEDLVLFAKRNLKHGGRLYFSYDADMLSEALYICKSNNLEPKRLMFLHKDIKSKAKLVFVECMLGGKSEIIIELPLFQQGENEITLPYNNIFKGLW